MAQVRWLAPSTHSRGEATVHRARGRFVRGGDGLRGVPAETAVSWHVSDHTTGYTRNQAQD
ncbi:hypothetical protein GCM10010279_29820 [Streptomyces mutabilis]|nr:hypothetical protein GCM10010279_29820 [Streptomyces mutabilis]